MQATDAIRIALREQTCESLNEVGGERLDQPTKCQPPGFRGFETAGSAILLSSAMRVAAGPTRRRNIVRVQPRARRSRALTARRRLFANPPGALRATAPA